MEALSMDGLPALKTIFPEHFYEQAEQGMHQHHPNSGANALFTQLNESSSHSQLQQQQHPQQQPQLQFNFNDGLYGQQYQHLHDNDQGQGSGRGGAMEGGRRAPKRSYDAAYGHTHPQQAQTQDPYTFNMGPNDPIPFPYPEPSGSLAPDEDVSGGDDLEGDDGEADGPNDEKRRHPCPRCGKRFNRPSSLKIHINTHTGAKPYECPFPGCGRTFNVSSNMRRHYRNHARRPPPPPLPQSGTIYPIPAPATQILASVPGTLPPIRTRGRPTEHNPSLSLPMTFDNGDQFSSDARTRHLSMGIYPPSDVRTNTAGIKGRGTGRGRGRPRKSEKNGNINSALMTPPYTNEGSEFERGRERVEENERNLYSQMVPYDTFGPGHGQLQRPGENANGLFAGGPPQMGMGLQMQMSMPLGMSGSSNVNINGSGIPPPTLFESFPVDPALSSSGGHENLNGGVESGADVDAEGEVDADGEFAPEADGERHGGEREEEVVRRPGPSTSNTRSSSDPTANIDIPVSLPTPSNGYLNTNSTGQYGQYAQQYETQYGGQYGHQHQILGPNVNIMGQMHMQHGYTPYNQYPPQHQRQKTVQSNEHSHMSIGSGHGVEHPKKSGVPEGAKDNELNGETDKSSLSTSMTPGAAPAPPYKLYTYPPPALLDGADPIGDSDNGSVFEDNEDDEDYTEKSVTKRGRGSAKRGSATRGKPRGRPKGSVKVPGRGRGRPRKNPLPVEDGAEAANKVDGANEDTPIETKSRLENARENERDDRDGNES